MIADVRGHFESFTGSVEFDEQDPQRSRASLWIEAASVNTGNALRDAHLRSPDFLSTEKYPHLSFESTRVELLDASRGRIIGNLTIRDMTREIVLDVEYAGQSKSPWGTVSAGFRATTRILRGEWGLVWNQLLETGGVLVDNQVTISVDIEILKQDRARSQDAPVSPESSSLGTRR